MAEKKGIGRRFIEYLKETVSQRLDLGAVGREALDTVVQKTAQGAAEFSQALNSQANAYVPYGDGQHAVDIQGPQQSYQQMLRDAAQHGQQEHEHGMER